MTTTAKIRELYENAIGKYFSLEYGTHPDARRYFEFISMKESNAARMASLLERAVEILKDEQDDVWHKEVRALFLSDFQKFQDGENG